MQTIDRFIIEKDNDKINLNFIIKAIKLMFKCLVAMISMT